MILGLLSKDKDSLQGEMVVFKPVTNGGFRPGRVARRRLPS